MELNGGPSSICHVDTQQMYPLPNSKSTTEIPFLLLNGEHIVHIGNSVDGLLVLTNYRLFLQLCESQHHVPLGLIEVVEQRDLFYLHIGCKDARTYRCTFVNNELSIEWFGILLKIYTPPRQLEELFAFFYYAWTKEKGDDTFTRLESNRSLVYDENAFRTEVERLKFDLHGAWKISLANKKYKLCPSYPPQLLVPACISDDTLEIVAKFRSSRRIPTVVWRHPGNGTVIARCSQPEVGWLGWRSAEDEDLLRAISDACTFDRGLKNMLDNTSYSPTSTISEESGQATEIAIQERKKVLIMDARSYTTAVANRARGGGCECPEYYPNCEIQFMNLANIHSIRKSFHALRQLCMSSADQPNWFSLLEGTRWLQHMSGLMKAAVTLVGAIERDGKPVLVHCSDGWDRTPQIVALAELLLDPYYRTIEGFRILIEREWLAFGHKFADRCGQATGSDDQNERCPVFLQWLDCVHQLVKQFPCSFEFSHTYLVKLAQHTYSNLFGTFLCNTKQERVERVNDITFSVWSFLNSTCFKNHLYAPPKANSNFSNNIVWPQCNVRDLQLWAEIYLGSLETQSTVEAGSNACPGPPGSMSYQMTKTRSYGDLVCATETCQLSNRRKSDPSITVEVLKVNGVSNSQSEVPDDDHVLQQNGIISNSLIQCNGCTTPTPSEYLKNDLDGIDNCNNDCIYKSTDVQKFLNDDSVDLLDTSKMVLQNGEPREENVSSINIIAQDNGKTMNHIDSNHFGICDVDTNEVSVQLESALVISNQKTDTVNEKDLNDEKLGDINSFESVCLRHPQCDLPKVNKVGDINHNGDVRLDDVDSGTECTEPTLSNSEPTITQDILKSIETSTETLTSEKVINSSHPKQIHGFDQLSNPDIFNGNVEYCKVCTQNIKFIHGKNSHHSNSTSGKNSRYSTPPLYSRTPSGTGWENMLTHYRSPHIHRCRLGDDGLVPLRSDLQDRLWQIIEEQRRKEDALQRELHTYRQALIKQVCHKCNYNDGDRPDDSSSVVDSICSVGEGQTSAVESLRSDISWEAVEESPTLVEGAPTLWVPDHAVSRCTGCQIQFWLGKRKHHCRNCGRIFCADCSENSAPLPSEQLYNPVRVCTTCYSKIRKDCGEIPERCKHVSSQATNNNPQITASSN